MEGDSGLNSLHLKYLTFAEFTEAFDVVTTLLGASPSTLQGALCKGGTLKLCQFLNKNISDRTLFHTLARFCNSFVFEVFQPVILKFQI